MKLSDIESKQLLPRFASDISWLMNALDSVIKPICERVKSIDAPLTLESVQACTDEELEALYNQYGVAEYYPDLSRETRDLMLFEMVKIYRYLGTPKAIEILCKYIFDNNPIVVKVLDNLAFNDNGELIDESLLDAFDVNVESQSAFLDEYANARILANIIRFSRNSQFLRYIYYDFPGYFDLPIHPLKAGIASINYENDVICEPVELNHYTFIVADATTGQIVSGFSNELVYGEIEGIVLQSPRLVYGVDISVPAAQFWFTANGRNETENTVLQSNSTVIVYDENGDTITDEDTIGMYDTASVLAYMQASGDMISKQDDVLIDDNGDLGLQVDSGPISAWSVFVERVFTLSFANTQLPGITITLPSDETGYKGTSITLPTMSGEYESGGKTWKPSAWDIGAFGSSYTLNADTVAHLIFEEVQSYEEITLYMASESKAVQTDVTSAFTGNVNSAYCYQLYTDEQCTLPWTGYDYSNDYEIWYYYNGEWARQVDSISAMPDYTTTGTPLRTIGFILMDTGYLWAVSNITGSSYSITTSSITLRIYPKDQQVFALYFNTSSVYNNISMAYNSGYDMYGSPNTGTSPIPLTSNFPGKGIIGVYGSAGNLVSSRYKNFAWAGSSKLRVGYYNTDAGTLSARLLLFTTDQYIDIAYINTSGDTSVSSGDAMRLYSKGGNYLGYFPSLFTYTPLALFKYNGSCADDSSGHYINTATLGNYTGPSDALCFKQTYGRISFSYIWYLRTPISQ